MPTVAWGGLLYGLYDPAYIMPMGRNLPYCTVIWGEGRGGAYNILVHAPLHPTSLQKSADLQHFNAIFIFYGIFLSTIFTVSSIEREETSYFYKVIRP